ncbi:MAG TPA: HD domain-containing phosphohydrolase [Egibacteraceae bacterium]|nr:HD domain-containing phosphohydrolase [Egibacteraceae bacterium]
MTTETAQVRGAGALARELALGLQAVSLYPPGHPTRSELGAQLLPHVRTLRDASSPRDPTLFVAHGSFYVDTTLLVRESLSLGRLAEAFVNAGVESVTFGPGMDAADLEELVDVLCADRPRPNSIGGLRLNAVRPSVQSDQHEWHERLAQLRSAYAAGVDVLREASARATAGEPIALEAPTAVVEQLASQVAHDPGYGVLLSAVKSYDEYTYFHMVNVCLMSVAMGQLIGLHHQQVLVLGLGGLLHDIGKVHVPVDVLNSPGRLDEEQWRLIQRHPVDGAGLLFSTGEGIYHPAASIVLEHHAAYDAGSGYPHLHDHPPAVPSRLVAVADCYDAVTSKRSYRDPLDRGQALNVIGAGAGQGLDPDAVKVFARLLGRYPVGSLVSLSSGEVGLVVRQHEHVPDRPTVLLLLDSTGAPAEVSERDLSANGCSVTGTVDPQEAGIDLTRFIVSGQLHSAGEAPESGGLVHEPSPGEPTPDGYVDTHRDAEHLHLEGRPDTDVAPPMP